MSIKSTIIESLSTKITNREEQLNNINLTISLESVGSEVLLPLLKLADALAEDIAQLKEEQADFMPAYYREFTSEEVTALENVQSDEQYSEKFGNRELAVFKVTLRNDYTGNLYYKYFWALYLEDVSNIYENSKTEMI